MPHQTRTADNQSTSFSAERPQCIGRASVHTPLPRFSREQLRFITLVCVLTGFGTVAAGSAVLMVAYLFYAVLAIRSGVYVMSGWPYLR
ncbi:hypothetical protein [Fodinicola acaciae]|uniref:hypothetical protein n=1 Tax=Fodinicola acaciae TaxID=2681555 RepID=UPI0013CFE28E|nr:hypothetical protein [Fodinicola acaciae]